MQLGSRRRHTAGIAPTGLRALLPLGLLGVGLAACGSSGATPSPTVKPGLDACVVGTWKSTGVHGTVTSADGTLHVRLSGGAGQTAVIRRDATVTIVYDGAQPQQGTGTDGSRYTIRMSGQLLGRVKTSGRQIILDVSDARDATETISKDSTVLQSVHPPDEQASEYACTPRIALAVTSNGITTDWLPA